MSNKIEIQTVYEGALGAPPMSAAAPGQGASAARLVDEGAGREAVAALAARLVDARAWSAALDPADELGVVLAHVLEALRDGADGVAVRLGLGSDFLMQIAKLRALRAAVARLGEVAGVDARLVVWAEPDASTWTVYDPWTNLLRNAAGVFAALTGGADLVTPRAWDAALGEPDASARRLADNTFHLLVHEGQVAASADPGAGSWAIEAWTEALAARAWALLVRIEATGLAGFDVEALAAATASERRGRIVKRLDGIVGTSLFPNLDEHRPERAGAAVDRGPARAAPFEALRARAERATRAPTAFLAGLGPLSEHGARLQWVKGLYEVAGVRALGSAVTGEAFHEVAPCVAAWRASGAPLAVLCGADATYTSVGLAMVAGLREAGARVVLAGRPKDLELPVDGKVWAGMDVVAALGAELDAQGVAP